jgi:hypothetical protein
LGIKASAQTSTELQRLGCLLAVFLPFALAVEILMQLTGIEVSDRSVWNWVQEVGETTMLQLQQHLEDFEQHSEVEPELLEPAVAAMTLVIAADGVTVPFRAQAGSPKGKIRWQEVKVAILARLHQTQTQAGHQITRLCQRRFVAVLGDIEALKPRLQLEAQRQGMATASQVAWISDGARGFWRLYRECFAHCAIGILDFYHAAQQVWKVAQLNPQPLPGRSAQQWFEQLRHRLRRGSVQSLIRQFTALSRYRATPETALPKLRRLRHYLSAHLDHLRYPLFKRLGLPIGSGMVESACKWLIQQRFKGTGMRWSEPGFNHLLHLRLAWCNHRFDRLFSSDNLTLSLYSPKR